jgi:hypothetical protein
MPTPPLVECDYIHPTLTVPDLAAAMFLEGAAGGSLATN